MTLFAETPNGSAAQTNRFHRLVLSDNNARPLIMLRTLRPREMRKLLIVWSGLSESNRHLNLGKVPYYHYTKAAQRPSFYSTTGTAATSLRPSPPRVKFAAGKKGQDTWVIRADFTTGERRWRSAKRV